MNSNVLISKIITILYHNKQPLYLIFCIVFVFFFTIIPLQKLVCESLIMKVQQWAFAMSLSEVLLELNALRFPLGFIVTPYMLFQYQKNEYIWYSHITWFMILCLVSKTKNISIHKILSVSIAWHDYYPLILYRWIRNERMKGSK